MKFGDFNYEEYKRKNTIHGTVAHPATMPGLLVQDQINRMFLMCDMDALDAIGRGYRGIDDRLSRQTTFILDCEVKYKRKDIDKFFERIRNPKHPHIRYDFGGKFWVDIDFKTEISTIKEYIIRIFRDRMQRLGLLANITMLVQICLHEKDDFIETFIENVEMMLETIVKLRKKNKKV